MRVPRDGVPGLPPGTVCELLSSVYGLNTAPRAWFDTLKTALEKEGWSQSQFYPCLFLLRSRSEGAAPEGALIAHVDDVAIGGQGPRFEQALRRLRERFTFRKWRMHSGEFTGAQIIQNKETHEITIHQKGYAAEIKPCKVNESGDSSPVSAQQLQAPMEADKASGAARAGARAHIV